MVLKQNIHFGKKKKIYLLLKLEWYKCNETNDNFDTEIINYTYIIKQYYVNKT